VFYGRISINGLIQNAKKWARQQNAPEMGDEAYII
jgi:hypothetical protein